MTVNRASARHLAKHAGERFYLCSEHCQIRFEAAPADFLGGRPEPEPMPAGTLYICPIELLNCELCSLRHSPWP